MVPTPAPPSSATPLAATTPQPQPPEPPSSDDTVIFGSSERSGAVVVVGFTLVVVAFGLAMVVDPVGHSGPTLAALSREAGHLRVRCACNCNAHPDEGDDGGGQNRHALKQRWRRSDDGRLTSPVYSIKPLCQVLLPLQLLGQSPDKQGPPIEAGVDVRWSCSGLPSMAH